MILKGVAILILMCGVVWIYDSRRIIKKHFDGLGDQNEGVLGLKIIGTIFSITGALMLYFLS